MLKKRFSRLQKVEYPFRVRIIKTVILRKLIQLRNFLFCDSAREQVLCLAIHTH